jgi:hypothetical protein
MDSIFQEAPAFPLQMSFLPTTDDGFLPIQLQSLELQLPMLQLPMHGLPCRFNFRFPASDTV